MVRIYFRLNASDYMFLKGCINITTLFEISKCIFTYYSD